VLSAGTFGTTYLLFKNTRAFGGFSDTLGSRFSGNGDLLAIIRNCTVAEGGKRRWRIIDPSIGPVITSAIRFGDALDGEDGRGCYIEDGGYPRPSTWAIDGVLGFRRSLKAAYVFLRRYLAGALGFNLDRNLSAELAKLLEASPASRASLPLLCMGRDRPTGRMRYRDPHLELDWDKNDSSDYFDPLGKRLKTLATAMGGRYRPNLPYRLLSQVYTAHPLGGCPMGRGKEVGFVDSFGQVYDCPGLYVADGSVMPGPVGPNPAYTIAALADRFATHLIENYRGGRS
jgi:cholesterol oxidase